MADASSFTPRSATAGAPDPNASGLFYDQMARLNFSVENLQAEQAKGERLANSRYEYNRGINNRALPRTLTQSRNTANTQGLAESGQLAQRQGVIQSGYVQKNAALSEARRNAVEGFQNRTRVGEKDASLKQAEDVEANRELGLREQEENPAKPAPPPAGGLAPSRAAAAAGAPKIAGVRAQPTTPGVRPSPRLTAVQRMKNKGRI